MKDDVTADADQTFARLRAGKDALRQFRRAMSWEEKLQELIQLQHMHCQIVSTRRALHPWEKPWASGPPPEHQT